MSEIGHGGYSKVYSIKFINKGIFALKLIILDKKNNNNYIKNNKKIKEENINSTQFKQENIIKTICLYENDIVLSIKEKRIINKDYIIKDIKKEYNVHSIIMEKAIYNNLTYLVHFFYNLNLMKIFINLKKIKLSYLQKLSVILIKQFIIEILNGLYYLKKSKYVHRDLKPENIVICKNFILKLIDFNELSLNIGKKTGKINLIKSTTTIMGPEYYKNDKSINLKDVEKLDIFSIGIIAYYCIFGKEIYDNSYKKNNNKTLELNEQYLEKGIKNINNNKNELNKFIIKCLNKNLEKRPTINDCIQDEILNKNNIDNKIIRCNNYNEETKLIIEYQKYSFLKKKRYNNRKKIKK